MAIEILQTLEVIETLENFIFKRRPPEEIRHQLDISYKIEDQSVIIFEIRPKWKNPELKMESPIAKTTFVKAKNKWKVFWQRSDLKWHAYDPKPFVNSVNEFIQVVDEDKHGCFWG
jgi:hypothetical protein